MSKWADALGRARTANAVEDELMAQLEIAQQAIVQLQNERDALREALDTIQHRARTALQGGIT